MGQALAVGRAEAAQKVPGCGLVQGGLRPTVFEVPLPLAVPDLPHRCCPDQVVDVPVSGLVTLQVSADSRGQATWTERTTDIDIPTF